MSIDQITDAVLAFHFIRPALMALLAVTGLLWWLVRKQKAGRNELPKEIAPHLASALTVGRAKNRVIQPIDAAALLLVLLILGAAGPTWSRVPNPLLSDTAPLVVVLKVSETMTATDLAPSRLERAKHKVLDILSERSGAKTALVAYSGTAHQVVPPTEDPEVIKPFLEGLDPSVMPHDGEAARTAREIALSILGAQDAPGAVLFLLDRLTDADVPAFNDTAAAGNAQVLFWIASRDEAARRNPERVNGAVVVEMTSDQSDVADVLRRIKAAYEAALARDESQKWNDEGWIFALPAAVLALLFFRRGWTMQWTAVLIAAGLGLSGTEVRAEGWKDWFLTPDQQGQIAFNNKRYQDASDLFEDPMWQAHALYRSGRYEEAAAAYAWQESTEAALGEGMALIKSRSYRDAIDAFRKAVERDPQNDAARHNLELARYILDYIETTREQSDTGEDSGIGADEVVYDNEAGRGADSEQPSRTESETVPETAEQWMRTVDTRTGDFLKSRFALEAARAGK